MRRRLDAMPDRVDIRDWVYQPSLAPLANRLIHCHEVPRILDQGEDGACTGFALAGVINFLLNRRRVKKAVSPHMLYHLARRYDEWPGDDYEGSSARGAMKAWVRHGVCEERTWKRHSKGGRIITATIAREAMHCPGGAFYRVMHRQVRDMHAALAETGILYCTLMVHAGWDRPGGVGEVLTYDDREGNSHTLRLPVIKRQGRADSGHAVALIGYTDQGFIVQNSWGEDWGEGGFALLPYEDYLLHSTDVWVAQLGVPVNTDLWIEKDWADTTAGISRVQEAINLNDIRPYIIDVGNNGELSDSGDYWTTDEDVEHLFRRKIPVRTRAWKKKRLLLYLHGGLNDEKAVARRVMAFRDVFLENQIYPIHIMWETGVMESLRGIISDLFTDVDERARGFSDWMKRFRDGLVEAKDRTFELTVARLGTGLWDEMKENARLASAHPRNEGAMQIIHQKAIEVLGGKGSEGSDGWEVHVVAHSAGSIFVGYALEILTKMGIALKSIQLLAPAITYERFVALYLPLVGRKGCPRPTMYMLSDVGELNDTVGPYGKSLLYLVSNAFERRRETPILGMRRFLADQRWDTTGAYAKVFDLFGPGAIVDGRPSLVLSGSDGGEEFSGSRSNSSSHGGFDNDPRTMNSVLVRILDGAPRRPFTIQDLRY